MKATGWDEISLQFHSTQWRVIITHYVQGTVLGPGLPEWIKPLWELPVIMPLMLHWDYFSTRPWAPWQHHCVLFVSGSPVFLSQDLTLSSSVNVDPESREHLGCLPLQPTPVPPLRFDCAELFPVPRGPMLSFSLGSSLPLFPRGADVLSGHHKLPYTWQLKVTSVYHLLISVGQKSRHTVPGLAAQVLMDLKSGVSGLHSHQWSGVFFQAHSDGYQSSVPCWLCTQGVTLRSKRPLSCPCHKGSFIFKVSNGELLTQQSPSCFKSLQLWSFSPGRNLSLRRALVMRSSSMRIISCSQSTVPGDIT